MSRGVQQPPTEQQLAFLHLAAEGGSSELEKALKVDVNWMTIVSARGRNALSYAAMADNLKNCMLLVKKGASWFTPDNGGAIPMHWAVQGGAIKVIKHLLTSVPKDPTGTSVFLIKDNEGVTPMHIAAKRSSAKILKMFVDAVDGEDIYTLARDNKDRSPLHYAAGSASVECVQLILDEDKLGLPVDQKDCYQLTPLMTAAGIELPQSVEIVNRLGQRKPVSLSARNRDGQTALHLAVAANNLLVIDALIGISGHVEVFDNKLRSPLHYAADAGHVEAVERLLDAGARNTTRDKYQVTPAHYAAQHSKKALQKILVHAKMNSLQSRQTTREEDEKEAVQDVKDNEQRSCLMWAVVAGNLESIKYLLSASRPDRQDQDIYGYNALHLAALMNDEAVVKELIRQGWNPNERTKFDMTALHLAAGRANTPDVLQALVTNGANLREVDAMGRTPIFMACFGGKAHNLNVMIRELGFSWYTREKIGNEIVHVPVRDSFNRTLLHAAAFAGYSACVSTMLQIEAERAVTLVAPLVGWKDIGGETALHVACAEGKTDCVITLCSKGAQKNALDRKGRTPLRHAYEKRAEERKSAYDAIIAYLERNGGLRRKSLVEFQAVVGIQRWWRTIHKWRSPKYTKIDYAAFKEQLRILSPSEKVVKRL